LIKSYVLKRDTFTAKGTIKQKKEKKAHHVI